MIKSDRIIGIFLLLLSGGLLFSIITMQYPQFDRDPGPAFVPILYMVGLTICAIALIFIPKKPKGNAESEEVNNDEQQEETSIKKENTIKMIVLFIALIIYVALFIGLGFFISTFLFLFFSCVYLAPERNPKLYIQTIIVSIITILILYYSLKVQLNIQLPKGIFIM